MIERSFDPVKDQRSHKNPLQLKRINVYSLYRFKASNIFLLSSMKFKHQVFFKLCFLNATVATDKRISFKMLARYSSAAYSNIFVKQKH